MSYTKDTISYSYYQVLHKLKSNTFGGILCFGDLVALFYFCLIKRRNKTAHQNIILPKKI